MDHYQIDTYVCEKCEKIFETTYDYCPHCGKKAKRQKIVKKRSLSVTILTISIILCVLGIMSYLLVTHARLEKIKEKAFEAMHGQNFSEAKYYFDQYKDVEQDFPLEYEYVKAGILIEEGKYLEALNAFKETQYPIPEALQNDLKQSIYDQGIQLYRANKNLTAQAYFSAIKDYRQSNNYLTLISADKLLASYDDLVGLIYFEDTKEIIVNNTIYAEKFLLGSWKSLYSKHYFNLDEERNFSTNLPKRSWGDEFILEKGLISIGTNNNYKANYTIRIVDKNTIVVFCLKDYQSYWLTRE